MGVSSAGASFADAADRLLERLVRRPSARDERWLAEAVDFPGRR
jgi:hypothetical protein